MSLSTDDINRRSSTDKDKRGSKRWSFFSTKDEISDKPSSTENDIIISKKESYQIAICQDGKFAVTFDTGKNSFNLEICVMIIIFY
jgi:hypothetical protein